MNTNLVFVPSVVVPAAVIVVFGSTPPRPEAVVFVTAVPKILVPEVVVPRAPKPAVGAVAVVVP